MRLLVATTNAHKVREIQTLLAGMPVDIVTLDRLPGVHAPDETGRTFEENARLKASYYAGATGMLTVAEDSGLAIDALAGAPGVESARFGGENASYPAKFALIYQALDRYKALDRAPGRERGARFVCALALADRGAIVFEASGVVEGRIAPAAKGDGGFGYDPIFSCPPYDRTFAEMTPEEKAAVSHRGQAFRALRTFLRTLS